MSDAEPTQMCSRCKKPRPVSVFSLKKNSRNLAKTCKPCTDKITASQQKRKGQARDADADDTAPTADTDCDDSSDTPPAENLSELTLCEFLDFIQDQGDTLTVEATVNVSSLWGSQERDEGTRRKIADELARLVWEKLSYRFTYVSFSLEAFLL